MRCSPLPSSIAAETPQTMSDPTIAPTPFTVCDLAALEALFGQPGEASIRKEVPSLHPVYRRWLEAAPFAVLRTSGPRALPASPRGVPAPLVTVLDEHTRLLPERRGNNRI